MCLIINLEEVCTTQEGKCQTTSSLRHWQAKEINQVRITDLFETMREDWRSPLDRHGHREEAQQSTQRLFLKVRQPNGIQQHQEEMSTVGMVQEQVQQALV